MNPSNDHIFEQLIAPLTSASYTTSTSARIDMDNANWATILVNVSSEKNTNATGVILSLRESDTTTLPAATATVVANVTLDRTAEGQHTYEVDQVGRKRYLFLVVTPDTTTNGNISYAASCVKGRLKSGPTGTTDMTDDTTNDSITIV